MKPWIKDAGSCQEAALPELVSGFLRENDAVLAFYVDRFLAMRGKVGLALPSPEKLTELRIFNTERELWAHRSMLGTPFSWRIADDAVLEARAASESDPFLQKPEHHYLDTTQTLDINTSVRVDGEPTNEWGCLRFRTTVGGTAALPIREGDGCVKLRSYLDYDENGVATLVDYRLTGFAPQKKGV